jgi:hypothetical protein
MDVIWTNIAKFLGPYRRLHGIESDSNNQEENTNNKGYTNRSEASEESDNNKTKENYINVVIKRKSRPRKYESAEERKMAKDLQTINKFA